VTESAADAALFDKYTAQHQAALATDAGKDPSHAPASKVSRRENARAPARSVAAKPARPAGNQPARDETGKFLPRAASNGAAAAAAPAAADVDSQEDRDGARAADAQGAADDPHAGDADPAAASGALSEAEAVRLLRDSRQSGDKDGIDRALRALLPDSKGLDEFNADGSRYAEFRQTVKKASDKLSQRETAIAEREANYERGMGVMQGLVKKYEATEGLIEKAKTDDLAFVELVESRTGKKLNDVMKRQLERQLGKQVDPEVAALRGELKAEKEKREERERQEAEARAQQERTQQIQRHLLFLDNELSKSADPRVVALVKNPQGMRAIFEAQQAHYDPKTGVTLSPEQAARYVLEQKQKELAPWQQVFAPAPAPAAETPAEPPAPRARTLSSARATSASGGARKLSDPELFEKYERLARLPG
jgi:hypothetical protein